MYENADKYFSGFLEALPASIQDFIELCQYHQIDLVLYGSALSDFLLRKQPDDYDFCLFIDNGNIDWLEGIFGMRISKYGDYTGQDDIYYLNYKNYKIDLKIVDKKSRSELSQQIIRGAPVCNTSFVFDITNNVFYDLYNNMKAIETKTIAFFKTEDILHRDCSKTIVLYFSFLHGKLDDFFIDASQIDIMRENLQHYDHGQYFDDYPWRKLTALFRIFSYSQAGLSNINQFWQIFNINSILLPWISNEALENIMTNTQTTQLEKLLLVNELSEQQFHQDTLQAYSILPLSYLQTMPSNAKTLMKDFIENAC